MTADTKLADQPGVASRRYDVILFVLLAAVTSYGGWSMLGEVSAGMDAAKFAADRFVQVAGAIALAIVGFHAFRRGGVRQFHVIAIGLIAGAVYFSREYGLSLLDPTNMDWVLRGDWAAHYGGWAMYRHTPWSWPPGATPSLLYPIGTSVVHSDSLPLLAMLLKPFSPWLPESFQYVGLWFYICCVLQGLFGALLVFRRSASLAIVLAGTQFFLYAPVFIQRTNHITLMAHWVLLAGVWLYFRDVGKERSLLSEAWPWWMLAAIAALDMPYLAAMLFAIHFAYWFRRAFIDHERSVAQVASASGIAVAISILLWYLSGAFIVHYADAATTIPYGVYSFNLLGFINSGGLSRVLPALPMAEGQYEGFAYLGIGILALLVLLAIDAIVFRKPVRWRSHWPLLIAAFGATAYAASTVLMIGSWKIIDLPLHSPLFATFRGSGRFIWVAYYLIILGVIWRVSRRWGPQTAAAILVVALIVQVWDFSRSYVYHAQLRIGTGWPPSVQPFGDPRWDELTQGRQHLTLVPPIMCGVQPGVSFVPFLLLAAKHSMTLNTAYVSRWDTTATAKYCGHFSAEVGAGGRNSDNLYVVSDEWLARFSQGEPKVACEMIEGMRACVVPSSQARNIPNQPDSQ